MSSSNVAVCCVLAMRFWCRTWRRKVFINARFKKVLGVHDFFSQKAKNTLPIRARAKLYFPSSDVAAPV